MISGLTTEGERPEVMIELARLTLADVKKLCYWLDTLSCLRSAVSWADSYFPATWRYT